MAMPWTTGPALSLATASARQLRTVIPAAPPPTILIFIAEPVRVIFLGEAARDKVALPCSISARRSVPALPADRRLWRGRNLGVVRTMHWLGEVPMGFGPIPQSTCQGRDLPICHNQ